MENILKNGGLSTPDIVIVVIYFLGKNAIWKTMTHYQYTYLNGGLPSPPVGIGLTVKTSELIFKISFGNAVKNKIFDKWKNGANRQINF